MHVLIAITIMAEASTGTVVQTSLLSFLFVYTLLISFGIILVALAILDAIDCTTQQTTCVSEHEIPLQWLRQVVASSIFVHACVYAYGIYAWQGAAVKCFFGAAVCIDVAVSLCSEQDVQG